MTRSALKWTLIACSACLVGEPLLVRSARATPAGGFTGVTLALGLFDELDVMNNAHPGEFGPAQTGRWMSLQKTKGESDVYVQNNTWKAGGTTGWHTHPGHSLIIVTAGTITVYDGDDPSCAPRTYTAGQGLIDRGGDHVHLIRNDDPSVDAQTIAVQVIPRGATRRVDAAEVPAACPPNLQ